jgi:carboxyl-terminal processing protease
VLVLVDRFSASASEIVAAALQDYRRAIVVGTPTHGKGTVQTLADLDRVTGRRSELGSIKLTIQQFFRVNGASTQRVGVTPDVRLPDSAAYIETGERELKHAIPWAQIPAVPFTPLSPAWKLPVLAQQSATRVAKHPLLSKVAATTAALKAQRDATQVPLARPAWEARRAAQRAAIEAATLDPKTVPAGVSIKLIDEPQPDASGGAGGRLARWQESVAHDPWLEESLRILDDAR